MSLAAIIVTYNRIKELTRCIEKVKSGSVVPDKIVVVNNASSDDTKKIITQKFPEIILINLEKNTGGSGGFHAGLKFAYENLQTDFYWLMDDDGYPSETCLEKLLSKTSEFDYVMPTSIDIDNHENLSWSVRKKNGKKTSSYAELKKSWGEILEYVTPFNGILLSKKCVQKVGYIDPKFFIWGDEYDHYYRCLQKNIKPVTYLDALFYHPSQKLPLVKICFGLFNVPFVESKFRMICLVRNYTYIYKTYNQKYKIIIKWIMYWWLFKITRGNDKEGWALYKKSVQDGLKGDFTRHLEYL